MKMTFTKSFAFLLLSTAVFAACSKSDDVKSNAEKITGKTWKYTGYGYDADFDYELSTTENQLKDCGKDNTFTFYSDSTGVDAEGPVKCSTWSTINFKWSTKDGKLSWNLYGSKTYTIKTLTESAFEFYMDEQLSNGVRRELHKFVVSK